MILTKKSIIDIIMGKKAILGKIYYGPDGVKYVGNKQKVRQQRMMH